MLPVPGIAARAVVAIAERMPEPALDISRIDVPIDGLPLELLGFTIAHVSDLHIGEGHWGPERAVEASRAIATEEPDVVINTGDFLAGEPPWDRVEVEVHHFSSSVTDAHRNLAILGNHDYEAGEDAARVLKEHLRAFGIEVLENSAVCVRGSVSFIGITDEVDGFEAGVEALLAASRPRIGLIHVPDLAERLPPGSADLLLAGHTHGGQITFPYLEGPIVRRFCGSQYVEGMYRVNDNPLYISRGLGCIGLPARFRAAPQLTFVRLTR